MNPDSSNRPLLAATLVGTALQIAMVVAGHWSKTVADLFAVMGMTLSLVAGLLFAVWARRPTGGSSARGGSIAGGACALVGILVSYALGDVPAVVLAFGTASSAVTGALGALIGHRLIRRERSA